MSNIVKIFCSLERHLNIASFHSHDSLKIRACTMPIEDYVLGTCLHPFFIHGIGVI